MKTCSHCGAHINDEANYCSFCGNNTMQQEVPTTATQRPTKRSKVLGLIAKIRLAEIGGTIFLLALIFTFYAVIMFALSAVIPPDEAIPLRWIEYAFLSIAVSMFVSLSWCIPLIVKVWKNIRNNRPISMATKICVLIFVDVAAGVVLLCRNN